ncbi:Hypothetical protein A7982_05847 [Minicystis rosea]|nr:Hypothetical protein A7982_05847 [Minicystis rosea]
MKAQPVLPTLPSFPALNGSEPERLALLAGLTFVEGATSGWNARDLLDWFKTYAVALNRKTPPVSVADAVVGTISLVPGAKLAGDRVARIEDLPKLLAMSRWRVVVTLRGLIAQPCDDRFLQAAIFAERVRRENSAWIAQPRDNDLLSDIVLSLFAVDVLSQRDFHDQNLCVCDVCGRISYNPAVTTRSGCGDHLPRTDSTSGFQGTGRPSFPPEGPPSGGRVKPR